MRRGFKGRRRITGAIIAAVAALSVGLNIQSHAPPRYDGAGYALLGQGLLEGRGYVELDHPDHPRHAHLPPGYPVALAALWRFTGRSATVAHIFSGLCATAAVVAAWCWFRGMYRPGVAAALGIALAVNWTWGRVGGAIQSEPLFLLLGQLALLATVRASRRGGIYEGLRLGALLAACVLTRQVGICLAVAAGVELALRGRRETLLAASAAFLVPLIPWGAWQTAVRHDTQLDRLQRSGWGRLILDQAVFYARRLPDQLIGPVVETATVFSGSRWSSALATVAAFGVSGIVVLGWTRTFRSDRRRLAGLVAACTGPLLLIWPFQEAGRFLIPLVPCVLVGGVEGLAAVGYRLKMNWKRGEPRTWAAWTLLAVSIPYSVYAVATDRAGALERSHGDFDAACAWIARHGDVRGPILSRHPGEVFWLTGREGLSPATDDPEEVAHLMGRYGIAYLLIDDERYARAPANPLRRFVEAEPRRLSRVWSRAGEGRSVSVFEVIEDGPRR